MASTLKLEKVAPPISGSVVSAPSSENTVADPRCPLTANCCVKFAAPFASVIVPAASSSSLLKSRVLSGRLETSPLERCSPPLARRTVSSRSAITVSFFSAESLNPAVSVPPALISMGFAAVEFTPFVFADTSYLPGAISGNVKAPVTLVFAVYSDPAASGCSRTVPSGTGLPAASRSTPVHEAREAASAVGTIASRNARSVVRISPARDRDKGTASENYSETERAASRPLVTCSFGCVFHLMLILPSTPP